MFGSDEKDSLIAYECRVNTEIYFESAESRFIHVSPVCGPVRPEFIGIGAFALKKCNLGIGFV